MLLEQKLLISTMKIVNKIPLLILYLLLLNSCQNKKTEIKTITSKDFKLKVTNNQKAVLVLFPCYPCDIENTKVEAKFLDKIENDGITTLLLNINMRLYLSEEEKASYSKLINSILDDNKVDKSNLYIGGFSGGGNISLLLTNHLLKTNNETKPKGVFVIDSPIDIEKLYYNAKADIAKHASEISYEESLYIVDLLEKSIGNPKDSIENYKKLSPYLSSIDYNENIKYLKDIKVNLYCEPDLEWQGENRNRKYEELNAYMLDKACQSLKKLGSTKAKLIKTKNKGFRANGEKNPHSWSLVNKKNLLDWINE
jgi:hypothetical protein